MSSPHGSQSHASSSAKSSLRNVGASGQVARHSVDVQPKPRASIASNEPESPATVGQTVLAFRLYEALRAGDTAFISKALRSSPPPENVLHLAVQCASVQVLEFILSTTTATQNADQQSTPYLDINSRDGQTGNTPLHLAAQLGRLDMLGLLLSQPTVNDALPNFSGKLPIDLARSPAAFEKLSVARAIFVEESTEKLMRLVNEKNYEAIEAFLEQDRVKAALDLNTVEVSSGASPKSSTTTVNKTKGGPDTSTGSTLLHDAARRKDTRLIQILLLHGADPFRRDRKGKLPQDVTKDERVKGVLKKSPARVVAERGIEERAVLGNPNNFLIPARPSSGASSSVSLAAPGHGKESREMKGYLKKWTNYTGGWKLRWFILEDGVLSYYKNQDDVASACRGAINMRIAKLYMDPSEKTRFEIQGKSSVKYHLRANHAIEAKRWYWSLNNAIQWAKDEARDEELKKKDEQERFGRIKEQQKQSVGAGDVPIHSKRNSKAPSITLSSTGAPSGNSISESIKQGEESDFNDAAETSVNFRDRGETSEAEDDDDSDEAVQEPPSADSLALFANSARLQLDLLSQVCLALEIEKQKNPNLTLGDPTTTEMLASYDTAVTSLKGLFEDVLRISRERDSYWKRQLEKEAGLRTVWEENMMRLAREQERLESEMGQARDKQKKTKRVLKTVLRESNATAAFSAARKAPTDTVPADPVSLSIDSAAVDVAGVVRARRHSVISAKDADMVFSDESSDEDDEEFFDAVDAGEVEVLPEIPTSPPPAELATEEQNEAVDSRQTKLVAIKSAFKGYEDPPRFKLAKDSDDRPKISLWGILKSMIGKDMTKMTLPVSFNECTSLLQRVAEDMEYTDLLDHAADRMDPTERMVYVAAFAASEYSSTTNRVAKPFNPLLGETYEYVRPDKGYRFFIEQVSHHPPIGAAWAESPKWDYWGESAVKSKFYGKSFDINPLGTWFLRLRPISGGEELYTWKKVTSSVVGIITGSPVIDNYGRMEITNHTTGEKCILDFKPRGWRAANAYEVKGRILDDTETQRWSIGGRWNDKIYARLSPGYDAEVSSPTGNESIRSGTSGGGHAAFLVWENHPRPPAPFNLTPFAITLNALPEKLKPHLCPTDTRLRPDQRAMEDGEYDFAAEEKNRLEEKQRAKRREREMKGEEYKPRWFTKGKCEITGEEYWVFNEEYWKMRAAVSEGKGTWERVEDIF